MSANVIGSDKCAKIPPEGNADVQRDRRVEHKNVVLQLKLHTLPKYGGRQCIQMVPQWTAGTSWCGLTLNIFKALALMLVMLLVLGLVFTVISKIVFANTLVVLAVLVVIMVLGVACATEQSQLRHSQSCKAGGVFSPESPHLKLHMLGKVSQAAVYCPPATNITGCMLLASSSCLQTDIL